MTPERWKQIEEVYEAVDSAAEPERAALLDRLCDGDSHLRHEVEQLLAGVFDGVFLQDLVGEAASQLAAAGRDLTGQKLGPYRLIRLIGRGGMGEVYSAEDSRLGRQVALKLLPALRSLDRDRILRFHREARAASALNHPNIVTVHDFAESGGVYYIATELVEGKTLREMMAAERLSVPEVVTIASQIAGGLSAAHAAGVVHSDIKPENMMVRPDGYVKILDFGLAKLRRTQANAETATLQTIPGAIEGTAAYMSPEQAQGRRVDARSDIFSFGLVLYEVLSGQHPFRGDSWISTIAAILHTEPRPLRDIDPAIPEWIDRLVSRCVQKDPAKRFQSMLEVKRALAEASVPDSAQENTPSIAVLPFANLSAGKDSEYFSDGLTEEIINALAKTPDLRVIARTSAFAFRGKEQDLRAIGQRLRVGTILEGSVRSAGNRVRITAQLIRVADESHLWSERYDREMTDIFAIQDDISQAIADALKVKLAAPRLSSPSVEAYQSYLKGLYWFQRITANSLVKAKEAFEHALREDPGYAPAYSGLAMLYFILTILGLKPLIETAPLAKSAAEKALAIDRTLSDAHSVLGQIACTVDYDWKAAERHFQAALSVEAVPSGVRIRYVFFFLIPLRRFDEALAQCRRAVETDPLAMVVLSGLPVALTCKGRYDDAIEHASAALELHPDSWLLHYAISMPQYRTGHLDQAIASMEAAVRLAPFDGFLQGILAAYYVESGESGRAETLMQGVTERSSKSYVSPVCFAVYYCALGQADRMFEYFEAAFAVSDPNLTRVNLWPGFEPYYSDPRFRDLLNRMNLG